MASIAELIALVPPPSRAPGRRDWASVDQELGFETPQDYQSIIDTYGRGNFSGFLYVMQPLDDNRSLDLTFRTNISQDALRALTNEVIPYPIDSLVQCASTDNGDSIYWLTSRSPHDPNKWPLVMNAARDDEWAEFDGNLLDFLVAIFNRSYVFPIFPDDFPDFAGVPARRGRPI
ncbi:SMI1/KNR4 family protein [Mycolicibacterium sp. HS_4_1]